MPVDLKKLEEQFKEFFDNTTQEDFENFVKDYNARLTPSIESQEEMWDEVNDVCHKYVRNNAIWKLTEQFTITRK